MLPPQSARKPGDSAAGSDSVSVVVADGWGVVDVPIRGLQNGAPDGLALVDPAGVPVQFLSYEGSFTATDGAALGLHSVDIAVAESGATPAGDSLQLVGSGSRYGDFSWVAAGASFGAVNEGQRFVTAQASQPPAAALPAPPGLLLTGLGLLALSRRYGVGSLRGRECSSTAT